MIRRVLSARDVGTRSGTVLVTGGEFPAGLALLRGLRAGGYAPIAGLAAGDAPAAWSRAPIDKLAVPDPLVDAEAHAAALSEAAAAMGAAAVLPGTDASLLAMAEHRRLFEGGTIVAVPPLEVVRRATDKLEMAAVARRVGMDTPRTHAGADAHAYPGPFPAVVKPARSVVTSDGASWRRVSAEQVDDARHLEQELACMRDARPLVQPFVEGRLRTVNGVAWDGRIVCCVHKRARRIWPPSAGVFTYGETVAPDAALEGACERFLDSLGWSGIFNLQFIETPAGEQLLIDLNPRAYHSLALAIRAGANLPAVWCDLVLGGLARACRVRPGVRFRSEVQDLQWASAALRTGDLRGALRVGRPHRGTVHALFDLRDPGPLLRVALRRLR